MAQGAGGKVRDAVGVEEAPVDDDRSPGVRLWRLWNEMWSAPDTGKLARTKFEQP